MAVSIPPQDSPSRGEPPGDVDDPSARERRPPDRRRVRAALRGHAGPQEGRADRRSRLRALTGPAAVPRKAACSSDLLACRVRGQTLRASRSATIAPCAWTWTTCPSPTACCSSSRNMAAGCGSVTMGTSRAHPDLVAEVASSSVSYDLGTKLNAYRRNGVREYVVWRVLDRQLDWFVNRRRAIRSALARSRTGSSGAPSSPVSGSIRPRYWLAT